MPGGFAPRFAIEAGFLILLGVGAGIADLRAVVIVALLAAGWALVSALELAIWRAEARTVAPRMPPVVAPDPDPEVGSPADDPEQSEEYPLRPDAGLETSEEAEEYTRVLATPETAAPSETEP